MSFGFVYVGDSIVIGRDESSVLARIVTKVQVLSVDRRRLTRRFPNRSVSARKYGITLQVLEFLFRFCSASKFVDVRSAGATYLFRQGSSGYSNYVYLYFFINYGRLIVIRFVGVIAKGGGGMFEVGFVGRVGVLKSYVYDSTVCVRVLVYFLA